MVGINIELLVARVKEKYPEAHARIIYDNSRQFVSKDFKDLISVLELYETSAIICHPQSNGKLVSVADKLESKNWESEIFSNLSDDYSDSDLYQQLVEEIYDVKDPLDSEEWTAELYRIAETAKK